MIAFLMGMFFSTQAADHVKGNGKLSTKKITIDDFTDAYSGNSPSST